MIIAKTIVGEYELTLSEEELNYEVEARFAGEVVETGAHEYKLEALEAYLSLVKRIVKRA